MPVCHGLSYCRPHLPHDPATYTSINSLSGGAGSWLRFQGAQPDSWALWGPQCCPLGRWGHRWIRNSDCKHWSPPSELAFLHEASRELLGQPGSRVGATGLCAGT